MYFEYVYSNISIIFASYGLILKKIFFIFFIKRTRSKRTQFLINFFKIEYRLKPGEIACFNNRRILHGRRSFKSNKGIRHFQVYIGKFINYFKF